MPTGWAPGGGAQPPSHVTASCVVVASSRNPPATASASAPSSAAVSVTTRGVQRPTRSSAQARRTGPVTASGATTSTVLTRCSSAQLAQLVGVDRAVPLGDLDGQGEQQRGHGGRDDDVGEHHRLHHRVDHRARPGAARPEDRDGRAALEPGRDEQDVGARLRDRERDDGVDQVAAADDAERADEDQPAGDRPGHDGEGHDASPEEMTTSWRRNWPSSDTTPAPTPMPATTLSARTVPEDSGAPSTPTGRTFARNPAPVSRPAAPMTTNSPLPAGSSSGAHRVGRSHCSVGKLPAR